MAFELPYGDLRELRTKLSEDQMKKYREVFALFDLDCDGVISTDEVGHVMRACGLCLTEADLQQFLDEFSGEDPTNVDFPQFLTIMARKIKEVPQDDDMEDLRNAFRVFDKENNGYISIRDLKVIIMQLGESMTETEADNMIKDADVHGEGMIKIEDYIKKLCGT